MFLRKLVIASSVISHHVSGKMRWNHGYTSDKLHDEMEEEIIFNRYFFAKGQEAFSLSPPPPLHSSLPHSFSMLWFHHGVCLKQNGCLLFEKVSSAIWLQKIIIIFSFWFVLLYLPICLSLLDKGKEIPWLWSDNSYW